MKLRWLSLSLALCLCGCAPQLTAVYGFGFDTELTILVEPEHTEAARAVMELCREDEKIFSRFATDSALARLNRGEAVEDAALVQVVEGALELCAASDGALDITIAPLSDLWDVKHRTAPPDPEEIAAAQQCVDYRQVRMDGARIDLDGVVLDLGAVAKGYEADRLLAALKARGVEEAVVNLGGNLALYGAEMTVGIQDPFDLSKIYARVTLDRGALATCGGYQRFFVSDGTTYHHVLDPRTGYPADSGLASATVASDSAMMADALSTAIFVLGEERGMALAAQYGASVFLIRADGSCAVSDDFPTAVMERE